MDILMKEISPNKCCAELDCLVQRFVTQPRQHAYEKYPRCIWPDGCTSLTQLSGTDKVGKMFAITLVALTREGLDFFFPSIARRSGNLDKVGVFFSTNVMLLGMAQARQVLDGQRRSCLCQCHTID
jgi:hypothetical protein